MRCKNCGHINPIDSLFCENCGQRLPTEEFCGHCGKKIAGTECFCPHCGKAILGRNASVKELGEKIKQGMDDAVEKLNTSNKTMLGDLYVNGEFVKKNLEKGIQLLEKANEVGDPQAARLLAERYLDGDGVPENIPRANYYWTTAVKNGEESQKAIYYAGLAWFYGVGVERDFKWARKCFEKLIFDDTNAILGSMLFEGVGGPVDRKEGEKRLRKAIESSDPKISLDAMNNLGMYFYRASERLYEAIQLFTAAAERGNTQAQVNLGKAYYEGKGVLKNEEKAVYYFRMAAAQGNEIAISNLKAIGHSVTATKYKAQHDEERTTKREEPTNRKKAVFLFISNVVMGLLMLLNWVKSDGLKNLGSFVGDFSGSATLFSLSKLLSDLGELISNETLSEIGMLIIAATVIALILYAFSLITLFKKEEEKTIVLLRIGCIITIFMVVSMIACVIYVNADIKEMSYGFVSNCFSLTASPIIAAVFGLFLIFFGLKKIKETEEV